MQKQERLQAALHFVGASKPAAHKVFCDSDDTVKRFSPAQHLDTPAELLGRTYNRPRHAQLEAARLPAPAAVEDSLGRARCATSLVEPPAPACACAMPAEFDCKHVERMHNVSDSTQFAVAATSSLARLQRSAWAAGGRGRATGSWPAGSSGARSLTAPWHTSSWSKPSRCAAACCLLPARAAVPVQHFDAPQLAMLCGQKCRPFQPTNAMPAFAHTLLDCPVVIF